MFNLVFNLVCNRLFYQLQSYNIILEYVPFLAVLTLYYYLFPDFVIAYPKSLRQRV